jgi:hypothetical protein
MHATACLGNDAQILHSFSTPRSKHHHSPPQ